MSIARLIQNCETFFSYWIEYSIASIQICQETIAIQSNSWWIFQYDFLEVGLNRLVWKYVIENEILQRRSRSLANIIFSRLLDLAALEKFVSSFRIFKYIGIFSQ